MRWPRALAISGPVNAKRQSPRAQTLLEGQVRDVTDAGDAVVETARGIVMARGGLPAERVRIALDASRRGVLRGVTVAILEASPARIAPTCALAERCGGCPLMSMQLDAQRQLKLARVRRAVSGLSRAAVDVTLERVGDAFGYRRRARLAFACKGHAPVLGYHAHASRNLIDVNACPVLEPNLERALALLRERLLPALTGSGEIELSAIDAERVVADVHCDSAVPEASYRAAEALAQLAPLAQVALRVADGAPAQFGEPATSAAGAFSQVNTTVNARLCDLVLELADARDANVLELYAGQGNFTLQLAAQAASLLAVESHPVAANSCRENLRGHSYARARVLEAQVSAACIRDRYDVIVLDPPRAGAAELAAIAQRTRAQRVVYVSCHMTTLGRDLRSLHESGFELERAHALDMFPQTGHVEAVVRMRRIAS